MCRFFYAIARAVDTQFCAADAASAYAIIRRYIRTVDRSENEPAAAVVERDGLILLQRVSLCVDMLSLVELW